MAKVVDGRSQAVVVVRCRECGLSTGEEVTPCQGVSGSWHVVSGGNEE